MTRPWETLESVPTPDGVLELKRRGATDFLITVAGRILMTSVAHRSEDALAQLACAAVRTRPGVHALVSGLGMGFTLRSVLDALGRDARVDVAELNPVVAQWCRGPLGPLTGHAVDDARVTLQIADVSHVIGAAATGSGRDKFDAIILDMYEGPAQAGRQETDVLYGAAALARTYAALREGGVFAVWSEKPSSAFERRLAAAGFRVELHRSGRGTSVHAVYLAHAARRARPTPERGGRRR
jgi:spermidine synthase